jgi:DNA-binding response OmpR family regulator
MDKIKKKVLIIEDDQSQRKILSDTIEQSGYQVEVAVDGVEGVEKFLEFNPDLIILDILLPKQSGVQVLEEIRKIEKGKQTKVIVFSNVKTMESISKSVEFGAHVYYIKSNTSLSEIVDVINTEINKDN